VQLVQFSRLRDLILTDDIAGLLAALSKYGYLVQGNWAIRRYGVTALRGSVDAATRSTRDYRSCGFIDEHSEVYLEGRMALCRDYLLYLFSKERVISRREFSEARKYRPAHLIRLFDFLTPVWFAIPCFLHC